MAELVAEGAILRVSERGAAGPGVEQRLKDLGDIAEADPALMRDKIREWGGEGGAPFAEAAQMAAQFAEQQAGVAEVAALLHRADDDADAVVRVAARSVICFTIFEHQTDVVNKMLACL